MRFLLMTILIMIVASVSGQRNNPNLNSGNRLYRERKYDQALPEYLKAQNVTTNDAVVNFNLGNAYFRTSKFDQAENTFDNSASNARDSTMRQKAYYNKGVALSKQGKLEESIEAYKMAVLLDPADEDARVNLQKALLELKKKTPPPPEKKEEKKKKQQNNEDRKQPPPSKLTKKQVEQLLKALQQREQQVQQKMQQKNKSAGQQEKDW